MDELVSYLVTQTAIEGDRGASLPRLWYFVACFQQSAQVHPSYVRTLPLGDSDPTPATLETVPASNASTPPSKGGKKKGAVPAPTDLNDDPDYPVEGLDANYLRFLWSIILDDLGQYVRCIRGVARRVESKKSAASTKRRKTLSGAVVIPVGDDGTKVVDVWEASQFDISELVSTPLTDLYQRYGDHLRLLIPTHERELILSKTVTGDMSDQLRSVYDEILRHRAVGITQADMSKSMGLDPRSTFHFIKMLVSRSLVVKVPIVHRGTTTHLCLATQFAPFNPFHQSMVQALAQELPQMPSPASEPGPSQLSQPQPSNTSVGNNVDADGDITMTDDVADGGDEEGGDDAAVDEGATAEMIDRFEAAGIPMTAAITFPPLKELLSDDDPSSNALPSMFNNLVRHRICTLLAAQPEKSLAAEPIMHAVGLRPKDDARHRKWFNRTVASMVDSGYIDVEKVRAPPLLNKSGVPKSRGALLRVFKFKVALELPGQEKNTSLLSSASVTPLSLPSGVSTTALPAPDSSAMAVDAAPVPAGVIKRMRDPALMQQSGIMLDMPFEYQIVRLLANAPNGLTGSQIRRQLGNIASRPFNKVMERLLDPKKPVPKHAVVLRKVGENRGRERRFRYFADEIDPAFVAAVNAGQIVMPSHTQAQEQRQPEPSEGTCADSTPVAPSGAGMPAEERDMIAISSQPPDAAPAATSPQNGPAASELAAAAGTPSAGVNTDSEAERLLNDAIQILGLRGSVRITQESKRRQIVMLDIIIRKRIVEYNIDLLRLYDAAFYERYPLLIDDEYEDAMHKKNQRASLSKRRPQTDKKTMQRVVEHLRAAKLIDHQVITIPLLNGGFKFREFLAYKRADPPVTPDEVMAIARTTEINQHSVAPPPEWGLQRAVAQPGVAASNPLRHDPTAYPPPDLTGTAPVPEAATNGIDPKDPVPAPVPTKQRSNKSASKPKNQDHWRGVSIEYGWIDARMLRAKKLYQLLYDITSAEYAANPTGPPPTIDTTNINNRMSLGLYVQLIGHTDESEVLEQALVDDFDTPLADVDLRVRLELLGHEKKLRRYKMNLSLLINILTALNLIRPVDQYSSRSLPTFNTVTENAIVATYYTVPRTVRMLNYSAPRNDRVEGDEYDLSTETKMLAFWEMLELARMPKRADAIDRAKDVERAAGDEGKGGIRPTTPAHTDQPDKGGPSGEDKDIDKPTPPSTGTQGKIDVQAPAAATEGDNDARGNPELDPIKFMGLPRNWIATQALNRKNRTLLMKSFHALVRAGHVPYLMHIACLDIARQCNISLTHVKHFFRREYEKSGLVATGVKATKVGETPTDTNAMHSLESANAAAAAAAKHAPRVKKKRGNAQSRANAAAAAAAAASTFADPTIQAPDGPSSTPNTTAPVGPDGQVILDRRTLKRSVQILDPTTGKIDIARLKRTRAQWSPAEDQLLLYSYVILNQRVTLGMARFISWQQVQAVFPERHPDSIRRRINSLIRNPNYLIRIKQLERVWVTHSAECGKCNPQSLEHLEPVAGVVAGYHNLDLVTGVDHLSKIPLDTGMSAMPDEPGLPDSLEELMQDFEIVEPESQSLSEKVDQEATTRSRMLILYDHALYVPEREDPPAEDPIEKLLASSTLPKRARTRSRSNQDEARATATVGGDTESAMSDATAAVPVLPNETTRLLPEERQKVPVVIELLKMMCLTPDPQYDPARAYMLLAQFSQPVIETAVQLIRNEGALVKCRPTNNRSRAVPGRNYALSDRFCAQLFGHHAQQQIAQAVRCLNDLHVHMKAQQQQADPEHPPTEEDHMFTLDDFVDEGTMLALIDLLVAGHIRLSVQVDMAHVFAMQIVPARSRDFAMDMSVIMHVLPSLPEPTVMMSGDRIPSTHPSVLAQTPMVGQTSGTSADPVPMVRVGLMEHVWVDPRDLKSMATHCVRRPRQSPPQAQVQQQDQDHEDNRAAAVEFGSDDHQDDDLAAIHPTLQPWIVPRIWNNIHGHIVPAIWRSAMTCVLAWLMKSPGARVSWLCDRFKLVFQKAEVVELVEQLEQRGAVVTQVVDGEVHVFLVEGFFYRIL